MKLKSSDKKHVDKVFQELGPNHHKIVRLNKQYNSRVKKSRDNLKKEVQGHFDSYVKQIKSLAN